MKTKWICSLFVLALLCSCSSIRYLEIETKQSPRILLPSNLRRLIVVDRTVPQRDLMVESSIKARETTLTQATDTLSIDFCRWVGEALASSLALEDVRLLETPLVANGRSYASDELTPEEVALLCEEHEVDAVLSLDRLLFKMKTSVVSSVEEVAEELYHVALLGTMRLYRKGEQQPIEQLLLDDSLVVNMGPFQMVSYRPSELRQLVREALSEVMRYKAEETLRTFTSYWADEERWVYLSPNARWREADAAANMGDWLSAAQRWRQLYDEASTLKEQSHLASNIALAEELNGRLSEAVAWATIAYRASCDDEKSSDKQTERQKAYMESLQNRYKRSQQMRWRL